MRRTTTGFSLSGNNTEGGYVEEDVSPPIPANLADVFLVLALGIMLSLIMFWGVDVSTVAEVASEKLKQVEVDLTQGESQSSLEGDQYEEMGKVYRDVTTGDLYLLQE
jgi:hypothetical protein